MVNGSSFVEFHARRMGRNFLLLTLGLTLVAAGLFAAVAPEVLTMRDDPLPPVSVLAAGPTHSLTRTGQVFTLDVGPTLLDPGVSKVGGSAGTSPTRYLFVAVGDRFLMIATEKSIRPSSTITGGLRPLSRGPLTQKAIDASIEDEPQLTGKVLPIYFDTGASAERGGLVFLFIAALVLSAVALLVALKGAASRLRPSSSPLGRKLRKANAATANLSAVDGLRDIAVTNDHIVIVRLYRAVVIPRRDVIWVHGVQNKAYALVRVHLRSGKKVTKNFGMGQRSVDRRAAALSVIATAAPRAFVGFDRTLAKRWKRRNRSAMIAAVVEG